MAQAEENYNIQEALDLLTPSEKQRMSELTYELMEMGYTTLAFNHVVRRSMIQYRKSIISERVTADLLFLSCILVLVKPMASRHTERASSSYRVSPWCLIVIKQSNQALDL